MSVRHLAATLALLFFATATLAGDITNAKGPMSAGTGPYTVTFTGTTNCAAGETGLGLGLSFMDSNKKQYPSNLNWQAPGAGQSTNYTFTLTNIPAGTYSWAIHFTYKDSKGNIQVYTVSSSSSPVP